MKNVTEKVDGKLLNIDYKQVEKTLQKYFEGEGKTKYNELVEGDFEGRAYYVLVTKNENEKNFYGSNTTEEFGNSIKIEWLNNIKYPVAFRIENGKVAVDEELSKQYSEMKDKIENKLDSRNKIMIIDMIKQENVVSLKSSLEITEKRNEILQEYAKNTKDEGALYYILYESNIDGIYEVLKCENEELKKFGVLEMDLPDSAGVNTALRIENGKYVIDRDATKTITNEIIENANKILEKQNNHLKDCRIEGGLYCVTGDVYDRVYLTNLETNEKFEEVNLPKDLLKQTELGAVLKFENGTYKMVMKSTYQKGTQVRENNQFGNEKQEGTLYCVSEKEYYVGLINLNNGEEFEARDFQEELKNRITEGTILKYENGEYSFY